MSQKVTTCHSRLGLCEDHSVQVRYAAMASNGFKYKGVWLPENDRICDTMGDAKVTIRGIDMKENKLEPQRTSTVKALDR